MLKVVLDTNILVSSIFWSGASYKVAKLTARGKVEIYTSIAILDELRRVLKSRLRYNLPDAKIHEIMELTGTHSTLVYLKRKIRIAEDPKDNIFLECAAEAGADYIISGDKHLLDIKRFKGIRIVPPKEFLVIYNK